MHMRDFESKFEKENEEAQRRRDALRDRVLTQFGSSILFRVSRLKNNLLEKDQVHKIVE